MADDSKIPFFTQVQVAQFRWPVKVPVPADGKYIYACFTGVFKYLPADERKALEISGKPDLELARQVLLGVEDLVGDDGQVLPSSTELVERVLRVDRAAATVFGTYVMVMRGMAPEKN